MLNGQEISRYPRKTQVYYWLKNSRRERPARVESKIGNKKHAPSRSRRSPPPGGEGGGKGGGRGDKGRGELGRGRGRPSRCPARSAPLQSCRPSLRWRRRSNGVGFGGDGAYGVACCLDRRQRSLVDSSFNNRFFRATGPCNSCLTDSDRDGLDRQRRMTSSCPSVASGW